MIAKTASLMRTLRNFSYETVYSRSARSCARSCCETSRTCVRESAASFVHLKESPLPPSKATVVEACNAVKVLTFQVRRKIVD